MTLARNVPADEVAAAPCCDDCGCNGHEPGAHPLETIEMMPEHAVTGPADGIWTFDVTGMDCGDCARSVEAGVRLLPGVRAATVQFAAGTLVVTPDAGLVPDAVLAAVAQAGHHATLRGALSPTRAADASPWWWQRRVYELGVAAALWGVGFTLEHIGSAQVVSAVPYLAALLLGGYPMIRAAAFAVHTRRADMNVLMTIAACGAVALGQWSEGAASLVLFGIGMMLQALTVGRTRGAIANLLALTPATATVRHGDHSHTVPVGAVAVGDTVLVHPGERVPVDGEVVTGISMIDQSAITGESVPVAVEAGTGVFAGSMNGDGALDIRVTKPASDTTLARIVALVEEAQSSRAPAQAFVDRFAAVYTPLVIAGAVLVAIVPPLLVGGWRDWILRALTLLVVACPCALVISTPVALVAAIGAASRWGVLFKGGAALEALATARTIALDKTGTLTVGRPAVVAVHTCDGAPEAEVLATAAALEAGSEHPLGRAVIAAARARGVEAPHVSGYTASPGRGGSGMVAGIAASVGSVRWFTERGLWEDAGHEAYLAEGNATVCVERGGVMIGLLTLVDTVRAESADAVAALKALGLRVAMLTGDNTRTAATIAAATGVTTIYANLLPADKAETVRALAADGPVAMVGDGVNDAPALATASVGIAMGVAGTDVAIETADVALMRDDLSRLPFAVRLARETLAIIRQNIAFSLATKGVFLALTCMGVTNLWLAVVADMGTSLLVTANALRVLRARSENREERLG